KLQYLAVQAAWRLPGKQRFEKLAPLLDTLSAAKPSLRAPGQLVLGQFSHVFGVLDQELHGDEDEDEFEDEDDEEDEDDDDYDEEYDGEEDPAPPTDWDPRWAPALRKHLKGQNADAMAQALAVVAGEKAVPELLPLLSGNTGGIMRVLGH